LYKICFTDEYLNDSGHEFALRVQVTGLAGGRLLLKYALIYGLGNPPCALIICRLELI